MNKNLITLILKSLKAVIKGDFRKAIKINAKVTKILATYENAC